MTGPEVPQQPDGPVQPVVQPLPPVPAAGSVKQTTTVTTESRTVTPFSRKVEDGGFLTAIVLVSLWCLVAVLKSAGFKLGPCGKDPTGFPWEFVILCSVLVIPKTVGRATAGGIWDKLPGRGA